MNVVASDVLIPPLGLPGILRLPAAPRGIVVFAHGSGSSRLSPRNNAVAGTLAENGIANLLFDLLTAEEGNDRRLVFDIDLLANRLDDAVRWLTSQPRLAALPVGLFGASTGAAAALKAATTSATAVRAVVSRGGRPDLAMDCLGKVTAPTLLIVGESDSEVLQLNREALRRLNGEKSLVTIPGATHLFSEPGALEAAARHATQWFLSHFGFEATDSAIDRSRMGRQMAVQGTRHQRG